jgi:hypothetical protein
MGKSSHIDVLDGLGLIIKNNCNLMIACSAEPTTRTQAVTTYALADVAMSSGDFTMATDGTGRKCTVGAKAGVAVDVTGTHNHTAFVDGSRLLYVDTVVAPQVLTQGNTMNFAATDICKVGQPT